MKNASPTFFAFSVVVGMFFIEIDKTELNSGCKQDSEKNKTKSKIMSVLFEFSKKNDQKLMDSGFTPDFRKNITENESTSVIF